jgi:hypothetical protein
MYQFFLLAQAVCPKKDDYFFLVPYSHAFKGKINKSILNYFWVEKPLKLSES